MAMPEQGGRLRIDGTSTIDVESGDLDICLHRATYALAPAAGEPTELSFNRPCRFLAPPLKTPCFQVQRGWILHRFQQTGNIVVKGTGHRNFNDLSESVPFNGNIGAHYRRAGFLGSTAAQTASSIKEKPGYCPIVNFYDIDLLVLIAQSLNDVLLLKLALELWMKNPTADFFAVGYITS